MRRLRDLVARKVRGRTARQVTAPGGLHPVNWPTPWGVVLTERAGNPNVNHYYVTVSGTTVWVDTVTALGDAHLVGSLNYMSDMAAHRGAVRVWAERELSGAVPVTGAVPLAPVSAKHPLRPMRGDGAVSRAWHFADSYQDQLRYLEDTRQGGDQLWLVMLPPLELAWNQRFSTSWVLEWLLDAAAELRFRTMHVATDPAAWRYDGKFPDQLRQASRVVAVGLTDPAAGLLARLCPAMVHLGSTADQSLRTTAEVACAVADGDVAPTLASLHELVALARKVAS